MTQLSSDYLSRFVWGIFTGKILIFHNLHSNLQTDQQYEDKGDEQVTEEIIRIKKITGHYLVMDHSTCLDFYANFEDKPKYKTGFQNRITEPSNFLRPGILGSMWLSNIQCCIFMTFSLGIINLGTIQNKTPYSI